LTELEELTLNDNVLSGSLIALAISQVATHNHSFRCHGMYFAGAIPTEIGHLTKVCGLPFGPNKLTGPCIALSSGKSLRV